MNMLTSATPPNQTMSSREIAELTDKRHDHVMADIRTMLESLNIQSTEFSGDYKDSKGRTYPCFNLPKRETLILVSGYNIAMRAKIIDRWQELEAKQYLVIPQTLPEALRLAADLVEQKAVVEQKLAVAEPKAIALDQIADTTSLFTIRQTAKMIKSKERDLVNELLRRGWVYRDHRDALQPYAEKISRGYVTAVMTPVKHTSGEKRVFSQLRITAKGVTRLGYLAAKGAAA